MAVDKKRKRSEAHGKRPKAPSGNAKRQKTSVGKRVTSVDSLAWKSVDVPEMFDDAEGFYGLEEVEGVDIVRDGNTVKFVAAVAESGDDTTEFEGFDDAPLEGGDAGGGDLAPESAGPSHSVARETEAKTQKEGKKGVKEKAKKAQKEKKQPDAETADADPELEANVFAQAGDLAEADAANDDTDMSEWVPLDLSTQMLSAISRLRFAKPTPIQSRAIPEVINGHDVIGKAATGSGKTLAFGIPIVERWLAKTADAQPTDKRQPIALILSPTRELAHQIADHLKQLCAGLATSPYICSVTGGLAVQKQQRQLEKADIVIGTPGRMWEVMSTGTSVLAALREIDFLVVDEADRLLKDGHFKDAEEILKALDRTTPGDEDEEGPDDEDEPRHQRQTLVFSATFNKALQQKLAGKARYNLLGDAESLEYLLKKLNFREERPKYIDTNPVSQMAENLKEGLIQCGDLEKDLYLYAVLLLQPTRRALVFTNSINTVRRLTPFLQSLNLPAFALHSDMEQKARLRSIERFKADPKPNTTTTSSSSSSSSILIATDVAARGLDIPNIDLVIHYHVPRSADDYVHRSGRTARAARAGVSVLLCGPKEAVPTQRLIAKVHASAAAAANTPRSKLTSAGGGTGIVQTIDIDRRLVAHLRARVTLAKKITETALAKERGAKEDDWMRSAAEELGVEYDSDELEQAGSWKGRGSGKKAREKEARAVSKAEVKQWRWELRELLSKRVNTGVSERYLGGVDVDALLRGARGEFLGQVEGLGL